MENFKRARSVEQINIRKKQIKDACVELLIENGYENLNLTDISKSTGFARTVIYKHYKNKDEILLDVLGDQTLLLYKKMLVDLDGVRDDFKSVDVLDIMYSSFVEFDLFITLRSLMFLFIEKNSSLESIIEYKNKYKSIVPDFLTKLHGVFANASDDDIYYFWHQLNAILCSLKPMTTISDKQREAMDITHVDYSKINYDNYLKTMIKNCLLLIDK